MRRNGEYRFYNLIFPLYMIILLSPITWLFMLAGNFLIDSLMIWIGCLVLKIKNPIGIWKQSIIRVFLFGFLSDLLGALINTLLSILCMVFEAYTQISLTVNYFSWPGSLISALPAIAAGGWLIYLFNRRYSFRKTQLPAGQIRAISLLLAVCTAPWFMGASYDFWYLFS